MKLKSFGCSFIYGSDLNDAVAIPGEVTVPSQLTWPAHLARHLGYDYECWARPGSGNLQIAERILTHAVDPEPTLFVIGWTWIDRFDFTNSKISNHPVEEQWSNWRTIMPVDETNLAKTYYQELHTEYRDKLTTLMSMRLVIDTLKQKGHPFIMTYMDELMFNQRWNTTPAIIDLQEYVRPYTTNFKGKNFLEWSQSDGYPISTTFHPLEAAHQAAAEYIINIFNRQNIIGHK